MINKNYSSLSYIFFIAVAGARGRVKGMAFQMKALRISNGAGAKCQQILEFTYLWGRRHHYGDRLDHRLWAILINNR